VRTDNRQIVDALSDEEVIDLIGGELDRRLPGDMHDELDRYVAALPSLPVGLRSMAATYQLDVSITLDDLGWHFGNWHHHGYARETIAGLGVLGPPRAAEIFGAAYRAALQHWDRLGEEDWMEWYHGSELEKAVEPLNGEMWSLLDDEWRIMGWWVKYARAHPHFLHE
jgi:hypothetical protein